MLIAADATYTLDPHPTAWPCIPVNCSTVMVRAHPETNFLFCYRPHRFLRGLAQPLQTNVWRWPLLERGPRPGELVPWSESAPSGHAWPLQVATFHDLFVMSREYSTPEFRARFTAQARHAAENADRIIAVSHFTAREVETAAGRRSAADSRHSARRVGCPGQ